MLQSKSEHIIVKKSKINFLAKYNYPDFFMIAAVVTYAPLFMNLNLTFFDALLVWFCAAPFAALFLGTAYCNTMYAFKEKMCEKTNQNPEIQKLLHDGNEKRDHKRNHQLAKAFVLSLGIHNAFFHALYLMFSVFILSGFDPVKNLFFSVIFACAINLFISIFKQFTFLFLHIVNSQTSS